MIKKIIDLVLYGNFWIATGACAMTLQTQLILTGNLQLNALILFVFFATFLLYALHRIIGIVRLKEVPDLERYHVISKFRHHIMIYAVVAFIGSLYFFFWLKIQVQIALVVPALLSLGYVLPFLGKNKRLRDIGQVKIFLIAGVWAFITVALPIIDLGVGFSPKMVLILIERAVFIFAITLPFDIRDMKVDKQESLTTIPGRIGIEKTKKLAYASCTFAIALAFCNYVLDTYQISILVSLIIAYLITAWLISFSSRERHDYFYSGLLDGTIILQFVLVWLAYLITN